MNDSSQTQISNSLKWYMIPGDFKVPRQYHDLYERTYSHWKAMWTKILDVGDSLTSDSFLRQDILYPLEFDSKVIGLIAFNFFNLA